MFESQSSNVRMNILSTGQDHPDWDENNPNSYLKNNYLIPREDQKGPMFFVPKDRDYVVARLKGYAVIPAEEYQRLVALAEASGSNARCVGASIEDLTFNPDKTIGITGKLKDSNSLEIGHDLPK